MHRRHLPDTTDPATLLAGTLSDIPSGNRTDRDARNHAGYSGKHHSHDRSDYRSDGGILACNICHTSPVRPSAVSNCRDNT